MKKKYKVGDVIKAYERVLDAIMSSEEMKNKIKIRDMNLLLMASEYLEMYLNGLTKYEKN